MDTRVSYATLIASAPVVSLRRGTTLLLETLDAHFPAQGDSDKRPEAIWATWQTFVAAVHTLEAAGIAARHDGADDYVRERQLWNALTHRIAPVLGYTMIEIDRRSSMVQRS